MMYILDCSKFSHFLPFFFFFLFAPPAAAFPGAVPIGLFVESAAPVASVSISMAFCVAFDEAASAAASEGSGKPVMSAVISRVKDSNLLIIIADLALNLRHCSKR